MVNMLSSDDIVYGVARCLLFYTKLPSCSLSNLPRTPMKQTLIYIQVLINNTDRRCRKQDAKTLI